MARLGFVGYSLFCFSVFIYYTVFYSILYPVASPLEVLFWMGMGFLLYGVLYVPALYVWLGRLGHSPSWAFLAVIPIFSLVFAFYPTRVRGKKRHPRKLDNSEVGSQRVMRYGSFKDRESERFR